MSSEPKQPGSMDVAKVSGMQHSRLALEHVTDDVAVGRGHACDFLHEPSERQLAVGLRAELGQLAPDPNKVLKRSSFGVIEALVMKTSR